MSSINKRWQEGWAGVHRDYQDLYELTESYDEYVAMYRRKTMTMAGIKDITYRVHTLDNGLMVVRRWKDAESYDCNPASAEYKWVTDKVAVLRLLHDGEELEGVGCKIDKGTFWVYSKFEE